MAQFTSSRVQVMIHRSQMSEISRAAFRHELPILREMYGEDNVTVVSCADGVSDEDVRLDAKAEWSRLIDIYGMHPEFNSPLVTHVFNNQLSLMVAAARAEVELVSARVSEDGQVSVEQVGPKNYDNLETVRAALKDLGVQFTKKNGKAELTVLLRTAALEQLALHGQTPPMDASLGEIMALLATVEGAE